MASSSDESWAIWFSRERLAPGGGFGFVGLRAGIGKLLLRDEGEMLGAPVPAAVLERGFSRRKALLGFAQMHRGMLGQARIVARRGEVGAQRVELVGRGLLGGAAGQQQGRHGDGENSGHGLSYQRAG